MIGALQNATDDDNDDDDDDDGDVYVDHGRIIKCHYIAYSCTAYRAPMITGKAKKNTNRRQSWRRQRGKVSNFLRMCCTQSPGIKISDGNA